MKNGVKKIHLIGVAGSGMNGIARVLCQKNYQVSGSDLNFNQNVASLQEMGMKFYHNHDARNIDGADLVVVSSAIANTNPEIIAAKSKKIKVLKRAQVLADLMRNKRGICISGTHGKTTTTALITHLLNEAQMDPSYVIGSVLNNTNLSANLGKGEFFVVEADESDASFLNFSPEIAVVTNIEPDHMQTYGEDFTKLQRAFADFVGKIPFYGLGVFCIDDEKVAELCAQNKNPYITYGFSPEADIQAMNYRQEGLTSAFDVFIKETGEKFSLNLNLPGRHNVLNSLVCVALCQYLKIDRKVLQKALLGFQSTKRRLEFLGKFHNVPVFSDYGHHPTEIMMTYQSLKAAFPDKKIVLIFQPHRFSRLHELFPNFVDVLSKADQLILLDVYSAGEENLWQVDSALLAQKIAEKTKNVLLLTDSTPKNLSVSLTKFLGNNSIILFQGAGSIGKMAYELLKMDEN